MVSIYVITNRVNAKRYVGQSIDPTKRFAQHRKLARCGEDGAMYASIRKHGVINFEMQILEVCGSRVIANEREMFWIASTGSRTSQHGYNLTAGGDGGADPSAETRAKIGHAARNRSPESLAKMRQPRSAEARASMAAARQPVSLDERARRRAAQTGKTASAETRAKMSASQNARRVREKSN